jgi:ATP-dependent exoDNAse (exonuclease V) alpha subunit
VKFIPRIDLAPSDVNLPFVLKRRQFPIIPAYAMTINKSQGQTFECVGIYLNEPVFAHGQLYVALSRAKNPQQIKVFIKENELQGKLMKNEQRFTQNIVYTEIFQIP